MPISFLNKTDCGLNINSNWRCNYDWWLGGVTVRRWTYDQQIVGSALGRVAIKWLLRCVSKKLARLLDAASKFALFSVYGLNDEKLIKKQTYMKTEPRKLDSGVF